MPIIPRTEQAVEINPAPERAVDLNGGAIGQGLQALGKGVSSFALKMQEDKDDLDMFQTKMAVSKLKEEQDMRQRDYDLNIEGDGRVHTQRRLAEYDGIAEKTLQSLPNSQKARQWAALHLQSMRAHYGERSLSTQQNHIGYYKAAELENYGYTNIAGKVTSDPADFTTKLRELDAMVSGTKGITRQQRDAIFSKVTSLMVERFRESAVENGDVDASEKARQIIKSYQERAEAQPARQPTGQKFAADVEDAIGAAAVASGVDAGLLGTFARIESGGRPGVRTGSYKGLFQLSDAEFAKYGGGDIYNPTDNAAAAARKLKAEMDEFAGKYGREPTLNEIYMIHQQGVGGSDAHMKNPDRPAWLNMAGTGEGRQKGERWAKRAIWGNIPDDVKKQFPGGVESVTSGDFLRLWEKRAAKLSGSAVQGDLRTAHRETSEFLNDAGEPVSVSLDMGRAEGHAVRGLIHSLSQIDAATKTLREEAEMQRRVAGFLDGSIPYNPHDTEDNKAIDRTFEKAQLGRKMLAGDPKAIASAVDASVKLARPPKDISQGIIGLVLHNDPAKRQLGYETAASIMQARPHAFAGADHGEKIAKEARIFTELTTTGALTPKEAVGRIMEMATPEWAGKSKIREEDAKKLSKKLKAGDLADAFDPGAFSWGPDMGGAGGEDAVGLAAYKEAFETHYIATGNEDVAKRLASKEMRRTYGVNRLPAHQGTLGSEVVRYPVTSFYEPAPVKGGGMDHTWIEKDMEATIKGATGKDIKAKDIRAVADTKSQEEINRTGAPRYMLFYRDPDRPGEWVKLSVTDAAGREKRWAPDRTAYISEFAKQYEKDREEALRGTAAKDKAAAERPKFTAPTSGYTPPGDDAFDIGYEALALPEKFARREQEYRASRKLPPQRLFRMPNTGGK